MIIILPTFQAFHKPRGTSSSLTNRDNQTLFYENKEQIAIFRSIARCLIIRAIGEEKYILKFAFKGE